MFIRDLFLIEVVCYNQMNHIKIINKVKNKMKKKMTMDEKIKRINELYRKSKEDGLSVDEKKEQEELRCEYIASVRNNLRGQLDNIELVHPDGSKTLLTEKNKKIKLNQKENELQNEHKGN